MYAPGWGYLDLYGVTAKEFNSFVREDHIKNAF